MLCWRAGCASGCKTCDGNTRGPIPAFSGSGTGPILPIPGHIDSGTGKPVQQEPVCPEALNATVCDPQQRTVNTGAECGSPDDFFFFSPWRRPGSAGVLDSCGIAGGRVPGEGQGGYGAVYTNTTHAKLGDSGSALPHYPAGVTWRAGDVVEVAWALQANHGGGYSYRLCSLGSTLDEDCFKKTPLDFVGESAFRWGGRGGEVHYFNATYVTEGTSPEGSMWAINPVPRAWKSLTTGEWAGNYAQTGEGFQPFCPNDDGIYSCAGMWGPYNMEIVDKVKIPDNLPAGDYVLGWRWDCEYVLVVVVTEAAAVWRCWCWCWRRSWLWGW